MLTRQQYEHTVERAVRMLKQAGIVITAEERARLEVLRVKAKKQPQSV